MLFYTSLYAKNDFQASYGMLKPHDRYLAIKPYISLNPSKPREKSPLAIMMPGCLGWHPHHEEWRKKLIDLGFVVLYVDSFKARGLNSQSVLMKNVCSGKLVHGDERAGDVIAVLSEVLKDRSIDSEKIIIMGWSHGGWAALDLLVMQENGIVPPNLSENPLEPDTEISLALLYYPYCGSNTVNWQQKLPHSTNGFLFHGNKDRITSHRKCSLRLRRDKSTRIEFKEIKNAKHWFDNYTNSQTFNRRATNLTVSLSMRAIDELLYQKKQGQKPKFKQESLIELFNGIND